VSTPLAIPIITTILITMTMMITSAVLALTTWTCHHNNSSWGPHRGQITIQHCDQPTCLSGLQNSQGAMASRLGLYLQAALLLLQGAARNLLERHSHLSQLRRSHPAASAPVSLRCLSVLPAGTAG